MKKSIIPAILSISLLFFSCDSNHSDSKFSLSEADAVSSSSDDSKLLLDSNRQYKESAYLKMQVAQVTETKKKIRNIIKEQQGFILSSILNNEIENSKTTAISKDSSKEIKKIAISNSYSLKVPIQHLDTTICLLEAQGLYIDQSSQEAEDISPIWITSKEDDLIDKETIAQLKKTKNNIGNIQMQYDIKKGQITSLKNSREMQYQTRYCDLKVDIYQSPIIQSTLVANIDAYQIEQPPFGYALKSSMQDGIYLFRNLILGISHLWLVIIAAIIVFWIWRKYHSRKRLLKS